MLTGGCQCGAVRYEAGEPQALFVCHCRECQKQSASAFGISVRVRRSELNVLQGAVAYWERDADSGRRITCAFCPTCGSRLWHEKIDVPEFVNLKGGSLDRPPDLAAAVHIWTKRKLDGVVIPHGVKTFTGEPG
ncbi:MAG: GFA family protein [Hyphomicrobiaceae bacterium]|nr:GFA family protein [Hyphomicrobiaceae bacterium]